MAKGQFCAELDCGTLVAAENESKCSKHRVLVGQGVILCISDELEGMKLVGRVEEVDTKSARVKVLFEKRHGIVPDLTATFSSRFFRERREDNESWVLTAVLP
jgi:hypothetical protein